MSRKSLSGTGATRHRSIKIPNGLWSEFRSRCKENGTTASDVVRGCVEAYVEQQVRAELQREEDEFFGTVASPFDGGR